MDEAQEIILHEQSRLMKACKIMGYENIDFSLEMTASRVTVAGLH